MNREADLGEVCLPHTQRVRSLPGAVSQAAQTPTLTRVTCKYHSERREQTEERFDSLGRGKEPEALRSFLGKEVCIGAPAFWVILHWLHQSRAWSQLLVWEWVGPSQPALGVCHGFCHGWCTGTAMSGLHPFTSRFLHKRMGALCSVLWNVWSASGALH